MLQNALFIAAGTVLAAAVCLWLIGERGMPLRASTWRGLRAGGLRNIVNLKGLHLYVYGRWTQQYLDVLIHQIVPRLGAPGRKWVTDHYHGKVLTHEHAREIIKLDRDLTHRGLEQIIPYPAARDLILKGPPEIAAYECGCRHIRENPCQPTQVCLVIGQPFVDFILDHHPTRSRKLSQEDALGLLREEHERGHVHAAWFKDACLDRFYAICNCCKCCCGGIELMSRYNAASLAPSGYVAQAFGAACALCGACARTCPFDGISAEQPGVIVWEKCMGCGACTTQCPQGRLALVRDERKGLPLDVRLLN